MKIGIVCYPTQGGSVVMATELGLALTRRGHSVHFIAYDLPFRIKALPERARFHKVDVASYPLFKFPLYTVALISKISDVMEQESLDILHVHYAIPHSTAALMAKMMTCCENTKIITTLHGTDVLLVGLEPSYYKITKYSIERSDGITAVSNYLRDATFKGFGIDKDIEVIYNFADTSKFKPLPTSERSSKEARVIHISNFRAVKRVQDVVHAFNLIRQRLPARLVMVGDGPEKEGVKELAGALGIEKNIEFMNTISDVSEVLAKADLFLLPSQIESFGLAACEAMSCGVPVVAYNVGGLPEVIESGVDGYLVELGDIKGMAEIGLKILSNPSLGSEIGRRARAKVLKRFSQDKIIDLYEDYYRRIVGVRL